MPKVDFKKWINRSITIKLGLKALDGNISDEEVGGDENDNEETIVNESNHDTVLEIEISQKDMDSETEDYINNNNGNRVTMNNFL